MDVLVIVEFTESGDHCYGYNEYLDSVYSTFEEAKISLDTRIARYDGKHGNFKISFDGMNGNPFLEIILMKMGDSDRNVVFKTNSRQDRGEN